MGRIRLSIQNKQFCSQAKPSRFPLINGSSSCPNLVQIFFKSCPNLVQNLSKSCLKSFQILSKSCLKPFQILSKTFPNLVQILSKLVQILYKTCQNLVHIISRVLIINIFNVKEVKIYIKSFYKKINKTFFIICI